MKSIKTLPSFLILSFLSLGLFLIGPPSTEAISFDVAGGSSATVADGSCSLGEAMANIANQAQTWADCVLPGTSNVINLPEDTITLVGDLPSVTTPLSVVGQGRGISIIDGGGNNRIFKVNLGDIVSENSMTFDNFTANNIGNSINFEGCISVRHSDLGSQNQSLSLNNLELNDCGSRSLSTRMQGSSLSVNNVYIADSGGSGAGNGIFLERIGEVEINSSTFVDNSLAIHTNQSDLFGLDEVGSNISIRNSTFFSNEVAISMHSSNLSGPEKEVSLNLELLNNTIFGGGSDSVTSGYYGKMGTSGLLLKAGEDTAINVDAQNNLIAGNYFDSNVVNCNITVTTITTSNNLSDDTCAGVLGANDFASVTEVADTLDVLADNGGPVRTMALLIGSPALDQGATIGSIATDARGVSRPQGEFYDIGAYEKTVAEVDDPDPEPEDPDNPGPPGGATAGGTITPGIPRAGRLIGAMIVTMSLLALVVLWASEVRHKKSKRSTSEK